MAGLSIWLAKRLKTFTGLEAIPSARNGNIDGTADYSINLQDLKTWILSGYSSYTSFIQLQNLATIESTYPIGDSTILYYGIDEDLFYIWNGSTYITTNPSISISTQNKFKVTSAFGMIVNYYSDYQVALTAAISGNTVEMFDNAVLSTGSIFKNGVILKMNGFKLTVSGNLNLHTSNTVNIIDYGEIECVSGFIQLSTTFILNAPFVRFLSSQTNGYIFITTDTTQFNCIIGGFLGTNSGSYIYVDGASSGNIDITGSCYVTNEYVCQGILVNSQFDINNITININGDYTTDGSNGIFKYTYTSSSNLIVKGRNYNGKLVSISGFYYLNDITGTFGDGGVLNSSLGKVYCRNIFNTSAIPALTIFNMSIDCEDIYGNVDNTLHNINAKYYYGSIVAFTGFKYLSNQGGLYTPNYTSLVNATFAGSAKHIYSVDSINNIFRIDGRFTITCGGAGIINVTIDLPAGLVFATNLFPVTLNWNNSAGTSFGTGTLYWQDTTHIQLYATLPTSGTFVLYYSIVSN